jgi:hypothetical protein
LALPRHIVDWGRPLPAFVNDIDGVSPTLTNENITDIGLLCDEFGYEQLSATVAEFLAQHSSPEQRACQEVVALKAQNAAFASQIGALKAEVAELTAQSSRAVALLLAVAVKLFGAEQFLAETIKIGLETNADELGEMIGTFCPEMTWNQEIGAVRKCAPEYPLDKAITVVQKRFPKLKIRRAPPVVKKRKLHMSSGKETDRM